MAHVKQSLEGLFEEPNISSKKYSDHASHVQPDYVTVVNSHRRFVEVSPAFCKMLGYTAEQLVGRSYDEFTVPRTCNIPSVLQLFQKNGYMEGIWVFANRSGTKLFVRYEAVLREDGLYETRMELLGAGA